LRDKSNFVPQLTPATNIQLESVNTCSSFFSIRRNPRLDSNPRSLCSKLRSPMAAQNQDAQVNPLPVGFIRHLGFQFYLRFRFRFFLQEPSTELLIRTGANSRSYYLGPVGNSDPQDFIAAESQRIPFKAAPSPPPRWQDAFKNWPLPPIAGWKTWYRRVLADKSALTQNWDTLLRL
jgi:hypothetical protein